MGSSPREAPRNAAERSRNTPAKSLTSNFRLFNPNAAISFDRCVLGKQWTKILNCRNTRLLPWLSIWVKPRRTIRQIVDHNPSQSVYILSGLAGIYRFLNQAAKRTLGDSMSLWEILSLAVLFGFLIGLLYLFIEGELLRWVGNRPGGKGSAIQVRAAIAWSSVPEALLLFLFFPLIVLFGRDYFSSSVDWITPIVFLSILGISLLGLVLLIWSAFLLVNCLAEIHEFSFWKGLMTAAVGVLIVVIPLSLLLLGKQ